MSPEELAKELEEVHRGHADEGPSTFSMAADELRRLAARVAELHRELAETDDENTHRECENDCLRAALAGASKDAEWYALIRKGKVHIEPDSNSETYEIYVSDVLAPGTYCFEPSEFDATIAAIARTEGEKT